MLSPLSSNLQFGKKSERKYIIDNKLISDVCPGQFRYFDHLVTSDVLRSPLGISAVLPRSWRSGRSEVGMSDNMAVHLTFRLMMSSLSQCRRKDASSHTDTLRPDTGSCRNTHTHTHTQVHTHTHTHRWIYTYTHRYTQTYRCKQTCTHTHTHTHTHSSLRVV